MLRFLELKEELVCKEICHFESMKLQLLKGGWLRVALGNLLLMRILVKIMSK
jgi:hypothetical protein